jgi:uncharacterized membrane protein YfcA
VSTGLAIATIGLLIASAVQAATGFGFALVAGPVLYAVAPPSAAVALVLLLGEVVNILILFAEQRRPEIEWAAIRPCLAAAIPGLPIGALLVRVVPAATMQIAVGVAVCSIVVARLARRGPPRPARATGPGAAVAAGLAVGVLTTSTTTSGPPLAIWLTARRMPPARIRDAVTAIFFVLDLVGIFALVAVAGTGSLSHVSWLIALIPASVAGHFVGRRIFLRLSPPAYEPIVLTTAFLSGVLALATGLANN